MADISLVLFVTMAINGLKLYELINLALPLAVIMAAQTVLSSSSPGSSSSGASGATLTR